LKPVVCIWSDSPSAVFDFSPGLDGEFFGEEPAASFEGVTGFWTMFWDMFWFAWEVLNYLLGGPTLQNWHTLVPLGQVPEAVACGSTRQHNEKMWTETHATKWSDENGAMHCCRTTDRAPVHARRTLMPSARSQLARTKGSKIWNRIMKKGGKRWSTPHLEPNSQKNRNGTKLRLTIGIQNPKNRISKKGRANGLTVWHSFQRSKLKYWTSVQYYYLKLPP
jgi:hypothetical protein